MCHMVLYYNNFTCLLSEASLGSMKSAKQTDCIIIIIEASSDRRTHLRRSLTKGIQHVIESAIPNTYYLTYFKTLVVVRIKVGRQVTTTMSERVKLILE